MTVGLLPGSREKEITRHLPIMLKAAAILKEKYPMLQFLIVKAPTVGQDLLTPIMKEERFAVRLIDADTVNAINACDLCIVASGTATLETALLGKPMVVVYKTSWVTWAIAKLFVRITDIGLVNVVAGKRIVPECVQHRANAPTLARELENIFKDEVRIANIKAELAQLKRNLDLGGAGEHTAQEILSRLGLS
jgi:lipid-A-disaccharide synthase